MPKKGAIATHPNFAREVCADRVVNHAALMKPTGTEVQLEGVQEKIRNSNGAMHGVGPSASSENAWNIQEL